MLLVVKADAQIKNTALFLLRKPPSEIPQTPKDQSADTESEHVQAKYQCVTSYTLTSVYI